MSQWTYKVQFENPVAITMMKSELHLSSFERFLKQEYGTKVRAVDLMDEEEIEAFRRLNEFENILWQEGDL